MIFLTVGTQLPFDRLVRAFDAWLGEHPGHRCFGQIGRSGYAPAHMESATFLSGEEVHQRMSGADLIVGHAGMGTVITAARLGKPLLIMPRQCRFGEQRNDHQLASAEAFGRRPNVYVAADETEVGARMEEVLSVPTFRGEPLGPYAQPSLLEAVRNFIEGPR